MKHTLFLTCGIPGSGKSTWAKKQKDAIIISRDEIRFSMVSENEEYFSKEHKVFWEFIAQIQAAIDTPGTPKKVIANATHLTRKSRNKTLHALNLTNVDDIFVIVPTISLQDALYLNNQRKGRKKVPEKVIHQMYNSFERPEHDEHAIFKTIYIPVVINK